MEYSSDDKIINKFDISWKKIFKTGGAIITFFVGVISCEISRRSLNYVEKIEKKYHPVEISYHELSINKVLINIKENKDEDLIKIKEKVRENSPFFYKYLEEEIIEKLEEVNTYFLLDEDYSYKLYVLDSIKYDMFNPRLEKNSGEIKSRYAITINDDYTENNKFSIIKIPNERTLLLLNLTDGNHEIITEGNLNFKNKTNIVNKNKNMITVLSNSSPNINLIHMIYEDYNKNREIITYVVHDCNCFQVDGDARTNVNTFILIAINSTELNDTSFLREVYHNLIYKIKDNKKFSGENLGNHRILIPDTDLMDKSDSKIWEEKDLKSFNEFQKKLINERKDIIKYLEEIGE